MYVNAPINARLLIFDLDETLVHCYENNSEEGYADNCNT
jgi:hypothetical protein